MHWLWNAKTAPSAEESVGPPETPAPPPPPALNPQEAVAEGVFEEQRENTDAAIEAYRRAIEQFDRQRDSVAQAIFRLGEAYRQMGETAKAEVQYARILRESTDQVELTRMAHQRFYPASTKTADSDLPETGQGIARYVGDWMWTNTENPSDFARIILKAAGEAILFEDDKLMKGSWRLKDGTIYLSGEDKDIQLQPTSDGRLLTQGLGEGRTAYRKD